jgi:predicted small lipoprotein YifL
MNVARPLVIFCLGFGILGCGQKGPLVLPDAPKHKRVIPSLPPAPAPNTRVE